jgi:hypothetical protein
MNASVTSLMYRSNPDPGAAVGSWVDEQATILTIPDGDP